MLKRIFCLLLCCAVLAVHMPVMALAEDGICAHHPEHIDCGYVEGEAACGFVCEDCASAEPEKAVCTGLIDCTAQEHEEGCEKKAADDQAAANQPAPVLVETNAPVISGVTVSKTKITAGESVTVTMNVTDESELDLVYVKFETPLAGVTNMVEVHLTKTAEGVYSGTLTTDDTFAEGVYYAYYIVAQDVHENRNQINGDESVYFELVSDHNETNAPVINSVTLDKTRLAIGESVTVTMDVTDESELDQVYVKFESPFAGVVRMEQVNLTKGSDGLYRGTLTTDDTFACGTYYAYYIVAQDIYGNRTQINSDESVCFELVSGGVETNAPVIKSITLDKTEVTAGETVTVTAEIEDESDLADVHVYIETPLSGVGNQIFVRLTLGEDGLYRGTFTTDETFSNGNYYVDAFVAKDVHGNRTQVKDETVCFKLTGGLSDVTAPVIKSITFDKSEVTAGETVTIIAEIEDESTLADVHVYIETPLSGVGNQIFVRLTLGEDGLYRGTFTTDETFSNGNYYVDAFVAKDVHENRTQVKDETVCFKLTGGHSEVNAPVIKRMTLDKSKVTVGETVTITAEIEDESDLADVHVYIETPLSGVGNQIFVRLTLGEDGLYTGTLTTDETLPYGNYYVDAFVAKDVHGNRVQIKDETVCFELVGVSLETNAPVIHSVTLDKTQVCIGETVTVTMNVTDESELDQVYVKFDTPHAGVVKMVEVHLTKDTDGLYRGTLTTDETYPYGTYYAYYIVAQDVLTNRTQINSDKTVAFTVLCDENGHNWSEWVTEGDTTRRSCTICGYTEHKIVTGGGNVEVEVPDQPELDVEVDPVLPGEDNYILVEEKLEGASGENLAILKAFDINLKNDKGVHVQPDGTVKVKLPLDWSKDGNYKVYRVNDDGSITDMEAYRQGSHMVFETDHFTLYVIVEEDHEHDYQAEVTPPTCEADGYTTYTCGKCGDSYTDDPVTTQGHDYKPTVTPPTCEDDGYTDYTCSKCGTSYMDDVKGKLGHDYDDGVITTKPTCMTEGVKTYTCSRCGDTETEPVAKELNGHSFTNYKSDKNATCKKDGTETALCDYGCGKSNTTTDEGSKLGHSYDKNDVCVRCGLSRWSPDTGDHMLDAVAAMTVSAAALVVLLSRKKRK